MMKKYLWNKNKLNNLRWISNWIKEWIIKRFICFRFYVAVSPNESNKMKIKYKFCSEFRLKKLRWNKKYI